MIPHPNRVRAREPDPIPRVREAAGPRPNPALARGCGAVDRVGYCGRKARVLKGRRPKVPC